MNQQHQQQEMQIEICNRLVDWQSANRNQLKSTCFGNSSGVQQAQVL